MRICILSKEYPPDTGWGGIGAYTYQIAHGLREIGHDVEVVALAATDAGDGDAHPSGVVSELQHLEGIPVHRVQWKGMFKDFGTILISSPYSHYVIKTNMALWFKFTELHNARPFDVVESPEHLAEGLMPALTKQVPLVIKLHTPHSKFIAERFHNVVPSFDQQFIAMAERAAMLNADVLISPSEDLAQYVSEDTGVPLEEIKIVRNPVNANLFTPEGELALKPDGRVTVMFVGRLEARKGVHYLIDAIPEIVRQYSNVRFVIVGADTNSGRGKRSVMSELKQTLKQNGCLQYVEFVNKIPLSQMPAYYRSADVCIAPSLYDNAPYTCLEAMASGKAFIGTSAGGMKEYVVPGESGIIVPPADAAAIADAVLSLLKDAQLRERMGKAARARVLEKFHRTAIARDEIAVYELARQRHAESASSSFYRRTNDDCLADACEMLYAYHKMLYDLIYFKSWRFRVKHWARLTVKRPKLMLARALVKAARPITRFSHKGASLVERLERDIQSKEAERERILRQRMGCRN